MARPPPKVVVYILSISPSSTILSKNQLHVLPGLSVSLHLASHSPCAHLRKSRRFPKLSPQSNNKNRRKTLAPLIKGSCDLIYVNYSAIVPVRENTPLAQRLFFNIASTSSSSSTLASIPTTGQKCGNIEIRK